MGKLKRFFPYAMLGIWGAITAMSVPAAAMQWSAAGELTSIPYGHLDYCDRNPRDCRGHRVAAPLKLTDARLRMLQSVNNSVNRRVRPVSDQENYRKRDYWAMPSSGKGDCEDYVLAKRAQLLARGIAPSLLLITLVQGREAHVVLTVRTDQGDYILDNMRNDVLPVEKTSYRYIKMQSPAHAGQWVSIAGRSAAVAQN